MTRFTTQSKIAASVLSPAALALSTLLGASTANAGLSVNLLGVGTASADIWGHPASPTGPATHSFSTTGFLPGLTLGPGLALCNPLSAVSITSTVASPSGWRYTMDTRAAGGDTVGTAGSDLAQYAHPASGNSHARVEIAAETTAPTSIHLYGFMDLSDPGSVARLRLIDGPDAPEPHIIYEDLFLNPNSTESNRIIDLNITIPPGNGGNLFLQVDVYGSSLPAPSALALLGAGAIFIRRRR